MVALIVIGLCAWVAAGLALVLRVFAPVARRGRDFDDCMADHYGTERDE